MKQSNPLSSVLSTNNALHPFGNIDKTDGFWLRKMLTLFFLLLFISTFSNAIDLKGNIDKDSVIRLSSSPCNITGDVYIRNGAQLTIESGVVVNFSNAGYELYVGYSTSSLGKISANGVTFNGYGPITVDEQIIFRFNSTGTLDNCTFNNVSVVSNESSPSILNSTFLNSVYPIEFQNECSPTLNNLNLSGATNRGIKLSGTVNTDWTLQNYGHPYFLTAALAVNSGAKLTIAQNDTIKIVGAYAITAGASATSLGTINADGVIFQGVTTSTADQLSFKFGSTGSITNCTFTAYDLTCSVSSPEIKGNIFSNAFISLNESSPTIQDNTFGNVAYPVEFINECSPVLSNLIMNNVTNQGIKLTGTVNTNWTLQNYGYPYFITAAMTVNAGAIFTIADNNILNTVGAFALSIGTAATSLGTLNANAVTFQGVTTSAADQLAFKFGSTGKITNCSFTAYDLTCNASSPEIKNNTFNNAFISLNESSPTVQDNTFDNVAYPVEFINECSPTLSNLIMNNGVTNRGIKLTGTVNTNWTLQNYGYPYFITAAMTVNAGTIFTIADNNIMNTVGAFALSIGTATTSLGTLNANAVTFQGITTSAADQLAFKFGSTGKITNCTFTSYDLTCSVSSPEIKGNTFNSAFISLNESSPTVQDNTFDNVAYPVEFINECSPTLSNLIMNTVTNRGIKLSGTVNTNWTMQNYGYPYYLAAALTVNAAATLTIAQNDTIKFVGGFAISAGTAANSLGTINADKVNFQGVTNSTADQLAFKFGSTGKITNCSFIAADLTCSVSSPEVKTNSFNNAFISLNESSPTIQDNTFDNVTYPVEFINECSPTLSNLIMNTVTNRGIKMSGTVNTDWTMQNYGYPYFIAAALNVNAGATLTIAENDTIKFAGGFAISAGTATNSLGTINADKVNFQGVTNSTSDQLAFKFGSTGKITNCSFIAADLTCSVSSPEIKNNSFNNAFISLNESSPTIQDNTFDNVTYPVEFVNECSPSLSNLIMNTVTNRGIKLSGTVNTDWTMLNYGYPYYLAAALTVNTGATLTIAQNDSIKFVGGYAINAGTSVTSLGNIIANGAIFQGVTNSTSDQLAFKFGSTGKITNCSFIAADITCSVSSPEIKNNSFNSAFISLNESSPTIQDNTFDNVTYPVEFVNECSPMLSNMVMNAVTNQGIKLSGAVNTDWTLQNYGYPYFMPTALTVNTGATFTSAPDNTIFFSGVNLSVGSSLTSKGNFNAKRNFFRNLRTTDNMIYYRYEAGGELDSCVFTGIRVHIDASSPKITRSKFHKAQNAVLTANNAIPEINNNIFYNNTLALKNTGTNTINARNNYWGHKSGPIHPDNLNGLGEKIEGLVDFSGFAGKPIYGASKAQILVSNIAFDTTLVGAFHDMTFNVKSLGDIDLLIPAISTGDPSFIFQTPTSNRAWIEKGDSLDITLRFRPMEPKRYDVNAFVLTNDLDDSEHQINLTGTGLPILTFTPDTIQFDSLYYRSSHIQYLSITNVSDMNSVLIDSIVNHNFNFSVYQTSKPSLSKIKEVVNINENNDDIEDVETTVQNIRTNGFPVYKNTPSYLAIDFTPYKMLKDSDILEIHYNGGGVHKVQVLANLYADELSANILSLDYRQFPSIYLNIQVDTFAVNIKSLTEQDIEIYENGVRQTEGIKLTPPGQGDNTRLTDIVFIMDNSGSLGDEQAKVRENVNKFLTSLNGSGINYALGLCRYGASANSGNPIIEDNGNLTQDSEYFKNDLWKRNDISGGTEPGYYGIMQSASGFKFRPGSQKIFIIITDETPQQGSLGTLQKAIEACENQKITLFALTISNLYSMFKPITDKTNGRVFNITSEFNIILDMISSMVSDNFVVQYTSSDPVLNGIRRQVEVLIKYKSIVASDTTSYVPGAIPSIKRTANTLALHEKTWNPQTPLTIEVEVRDALPPYVNNVMLHFRTSNAANYISAQMISTDGVLYSAQIPDSVVLSPGVDYYITASDGMVSSDDPAIDAINNPYQIAVIPNIAPAIEHTPLTEGVFGQNLILQAIATDNTNVLASVELYYRKKGQLVFNKTTMTHKGNNIYEGEISRQFSTVDNIEYYIKATDDFGISSFAAWPNEPFEIKMKSSVGFNPINIGAEPDLYPNPVKNLKFVIRYNNLNSSDKFRVTLVNMAGVKLTELYNEILPLGNNIIPLKLNSVTSGIYFIEIITGTDIYFRKLVVE